MDFSVNSSATTNDLLGGDGRVERLVWVTKQLGSNGLFFFQDWHLSRFLLHESIHCFINGQFIATVVLGFSFIERSLAGRFFEIGRTELERANSESLLDAALEQEWLSSEEHQHLNILRSLRNPIVHFRDPGDPDRPEIRAILSAKEPYAMLEMDARLVLGAACRIANKTAI